MKKMEKKNCLSSIFCVKGELTKKKSDFGCNFILKLTPTNGAFNENCFLFIN